MLYRGDIRGRDLSRSSDQKRCQARLANQPRLAVIWLIYLREMRDQLRDRRTLFTIAVLPIVLYPLVGTLLLQIAQFTQQHPTSICLVGVEHLDQAPPLLQDGAFLPELVNNVDRIELSSYRWEQIAADADVGRRTSDWVREGRYDVVIVIPSGFADAERSGR